MLQINDLYFGYARRPFLLEDINLSLREGHIYGLLGKNGSGKSSLLKNMVGLAHPAKGKCLFNGTPVKNRPVSVLEDVYFLAEELYVPAITPARFVATTAPFYPRFSQSDFYHYLDVLSVDRNGIMDRQSFGQQKKAMIAFGLATHTSLLLMDEPTNGLDIPSKVQFRKLIASVQTEDRCMIISTHQVRDLDNLIDTLLVLHDRHILVNIALDEVVERLHFGFYTDTNMLPVLYEEMSIRGTAAIVANKTGEVSKTDLELLFNAIISGNPTLLHLLKNIRHE